MAVHALQDFHAVPLLPSPKPPATRRLSIGPKQPWPKRKRTEASKPTPAPLVPAPQEGYLALCLVLLSHGGERSREGTAQAHPWGRPPEPRHRCRCSICGKAFASYQALGGHKSSHRRPPAADPTPVSAARSDPWTSSKAQHRCAICLRSFATGQALGGHKRCHYVKGSLGARDFDLNLPPLLMIGAEEEEEIKKPKSYHLA